jgi:hypothetical protein
MTTRPARVGSDKLERQVIYNVKEFGWHAIHVLEDDGQPPCSEVVSVFRTGV